SYTRRARSIPPGIAHETCGCAFPAPTLRGMRVANSSRSRGARTERASTSADRRIQAMNSWTAVVVVAVVLLVVFGIVWSVFQRNRSRALRDRFGPEYERMLGEHGSRRRAERELEHRQRRVERLSLRPLPPDIRN